MVFFCGAGISYPAGLPGFDGLVRKLYDNFSDRVDPQIRDTINRAICDSQLDIAINLMEKYIAGGSKTIRKGLANILKVRLDAPTDTHEALLTLGKTRSNSMHLVTTNFDRLFEKAIAERLLKVDRFQAPLLPIPKDDQWDGLVYLHGLLTGQWPRDNQGDLIVSSGDFGRAYLRDGWAARFLSELFRNYTVCFVGYSIGDPMLRYMMDALAADRSPENMSREVFAFGSHAENEEEQSRHEWEAKSVRPILYLENSGHTYLHKTLLRWAETYRDGVRGKEQIVIELARTKPRESTQEDNFIARMLWALKDPTGLPAKRFSEHNSAPFLDWLYLSPLTNIFETGVQRGNWDDVTRQLMPWLTRHLNDPRLLLWLSQYGDRLDDRFVRLIEDRLNELSELKNKRKIDELRRIRQNSPNGIPSRLMWKLWCLLMTGCVKPGARNFDMYLWHDRFKRYGFTPTSRRELRKNLTPYISLSEPFRGSIENADGEKPQHINDLVNWEIKLSAGNVHDAVKRLSNDPQWQKALPELLPEFTSLLRSVLDLMRGLEAADDMNDMSYIYQPSISRHSQNRAFHDWTALIDLTWDAWIALKEESPEQAAMEVERWWGIRYPIFRRLVFLALAESS